jgi:hypothetical protein
MKPLYSQESKGKLGDACDRSKRCQILLGRLSFVLKTPGGAKGERHPFPSLVHDPASSDDLEPVYSRQIPSPTPSSTSCDVSREQRLPCIVSQLMCYKGEEGCALQSTLDDPVSPSKLFVGHIGPQRTLFE